MLRNNDKALKKKWNIVVEDIMGQMQLIKRRLFMIFVSGNFGKVHEFMKGKSKKHMQYTWRPFNAIIYLILKEQKVYGSCHGFAYFAEYFIAMGAPECAVESCYSVVKLLLSKNNTLDICILRTKLRILYFCRKEFNAETRKFIESLCMEYMDKTGRVPFIDKKRSKKVHGTVMDRYLIEEEMTLDNGEYDATSMFSDHDDSDHGSDEEIDLSDFRNVQVDCDLSILANDQ